MKLFEVEEHQKADNLLIACLNLKHHDIKLLIHQICLDHCMCFSHFLGAEDMMLDEKNVFIRLSA